MIRRRNTKLRVYRYLFDESDLADSFGIALVGTPAIQKNFVAFRKALTGRPASVRALLSGKLRPTGQKNILLGPLIVPDQNIYRADSSSEYIVRFSSSDTAKIARFLMSRLDADEPVRFNLEHRATTEVEAVLRNVFVKQKGDLLDALGYDDYPEGSLFISVFVPDTEVWEKYIVPQRVVGFSLEMVASVQPTNEYVPRSERYDVIKTKLSSHKIRARRDMDMLKRFLAMFASGDSIDAIKAAAQKELARLAMSELALADGGVLVQDDDGTAYIRRVAEDGSESYEIVPAGSHSLADGGTVVVSYSVEVVAPEGESAAEVVVDLPDQASEIEELRRQVAELSAKNEELMRKPASKAKLAAVPPSAPKATHGITISDSEYLTLVNKRRGKSN